MDFKQKVANYIRQNHLLHEHGKYLVALSGGADSVSLLLILQDLGFQIEACHCNFHLRGEESNRDEQFCEQLCEQHHIPFHRIHFDTLSYAKLHKESIEMAARNLRYCYFEQLRKDMDADDVCVAHHRDDSVETIIINLLRGTGINGLTGISPRNGHIIRPLLCVDRTDILSYLESLSQPHITDSSNLVDDVVRNKIRLNILPLLKEINPSVCDNIMNTAHHLSEASKILGSLSSLSQRQEEQVILEKKQILSQASPEYALYVNIAPYGFTGGKIQEIIASIHTVGKVWHSPTHQLLIDREEIIITPKREETFPPFKIPESGYYVYQHDCDGDKKISVKLMDKPNDFKPSKASMVVTLDADKISFPLILRLAQPGDRFHPFGMKGTKLVSDYLTDKKKNLFEKQAQKVITDGKNNIIWLVGERTSELCKITSATTHILRIEL